MERDEVQFTAEDLERMSFDERKKALSEAVARSWDDVRPEFRRRIEERATELASARRAGI